MKTQSLAIGLTAVNLVLLTCLLGSRLSTAVFAAATNTPQRSSTGPAATAAPAAAVEPILRGRALELVDERGQVRSRINVEPDGEVVFRLVDRTGAIRVKIGAGDNGSGLLLLDETTEPAVHMIARRAGTPAGRATTSLTLHGPDGRQRVLTP